METKGVGTWRWHEDGLLLVVVGRRGTSRPRHGQATSRDVSSRDAQDCAI